MFLKLLNVTKTAFAVYLIVKIFTVDLEEMARGLGLDYRLYGSKMHNL